MCELQISPPADADPQNFFWICGPIADPVVPWWVYYFLASAFEATIKFDILFAKAITEPLRAVI